MVLETSFVVSLSVFSKIKVFDFQNAFRCGEHGVHLMGQFHRILYNPDHRINFAEIFASSGLSSLSTIPVKFSVSLMSPVRIL
jgi:hypothetical protein